MTLRFASLFAILGLASACSGGSGSSGFGPDAGGASGSAGAGAAAGSGGLGGGAGAGASGGGGGAGGTGTGGSGGGSTAAWTLIENDYLYGAQALTGHPTDPNTIAVLIDHTPLAIGKPNTVTVAISPDSGKTLTSVNVMDTPDNAYIYSNGLVWDPKQPANIAAAFNFPYGFDFGDLWRFARSGDSGKSFQLQSMVQLDHLAYDAGLLVARAADALQISSDFGASFTAVKTPAGCTNALDFARTTTRDVFACGTSGAFHCQGTTCAASKLPASATLSTVRSFTSDPLRLVALGGTSPNTEVYLSTDSGQSFSAVQHLPQGAWRLQVDARAAGTTVVVNDAGSGHAVWRSKDSGATYTNVTPAVSIPNQRSLSTYAYDVGITAGGGLVAYTAAGVLKLAP